jgi:hypothetical protein
MLDAWARLSSRLGGRTRRSKRKDDADGGDQTGTAKPEG